MTEVERLETELGRAYRALHVMAACARDGRKPGNATLAYHSPTIGAAARFIHEDSLEGADYFIGKDVSILHEALKP